MYLNYLEAARMEAVEEMGISLMDMKAAGTIIVVREVHLVYRRSLEYGDRFTIHTWLDSYRNASAIFGQEVYNDADGALYLDGKVTWAVVNSDGRPVRIPPEIRKAMGFDDD